MLTAFLGDDLTLAFVIEGPDGPLNWTGKTVKARLVNPAGTTAVAPSVTLSAAAPGADAPNGKAVATWTNGTYPTLTIGQALLEVSVTDAGGKVTWPRLPVQILQGFT